MCYALFHILGSILDWNFLEAMEINVSNYLGDKFRPDMFSIKLSTRLEWASKWSKICLTHSCITLFYFIVLLK
jgi:hypothetical protein